MKITVTKSESVEANIPEYFEYLGGYCKCIGKQSILKVCDNEFTESLDLEPAIEIHNSRYYQIDISKIKPISKAEFDLAFLRTEKLFNELRNG
jgi:hypothetical protein